MKVFITGAAGFIGFHLAQALARQGHQVLGIDNFNDYYQVELKRQRHRILESLPSYRGDNCDICDMPRLKAHIDGFRPDCVVNLAAQAGVRYSIQNPHAYQKSNLEGFLNVLECVRNSAVPPRLVYASSSSVYGGNKEMPFAESQNVDSPKSLYAATKKANELMASAYSSLYGIQAIGLRFFTVYGPWGRPDMAYFLFAEAIRKGKPIKVFNNGEMWRDFTYVDDIVSGVIACVMANNLPVCDVYNIGNNRSERLMDMIVLLARELGVEKPAMEFLPMQLGDVPATYASVEKLKRAVGYQPTTPIEVGIPKFARWYKSWINSFPDAVPED